MRRARVLLADDHTIVAEALGALLGEHFTVVGTVADGAALIEAAHRLRPDVIVADIAMPVLSGLEALRRLTQDGIEIKVIFLTMHADVQLATEAVRAGASGYVLKHAASEELITAIQEVLQGRVYLTPLIMKDVLATLAGRGVQAAVNLTPRQREVLRLIAEGRTTKEIAWALHLSPRTVETHKYAMMQALGVQNTVELVRHAIRVGIVSADPASRPHTPQSP